MWHIIGNIYFVIFPAAMF